MDNYQWAFLPIPVLLEVFKRLDYKNVVKVSCVCRNWYEISRVEYLWKYLFYRNFKVESNVALIPGKNWYEEFKRLYYNVPLIQTENLTDHLNEVLHVSFSHNGKYFATCSKDGWVHLWDSKYPAKIKFSHDMKWFSWKYTQYSQFNESDSLLLVSGVHFGTPHSTSGEIAVFSIPDFELQCRVGSKPYDIFGTWYSDIHLLSGDLRWLAHLVSTSMLRLNKACQEVESEHVPVIKNLYRFYNRNASSIRAIMIANCLPNSELVDEKETCENDNDVKKDKSVGVEKGNPVSHRDIDNLAMSSSSSVVQNVAASSKAVDPDYEVPITYSAEYRMAEAISMSDSDTDSDFDERSSIDLSDYTQVEGEPIVSNDKYLIFTTGYKTYTPHQIGFKRIKPFPFPKRIDPGLSLRERLVLREKLRSASPPSEPNWLDYDAVCDKFDKVDHVIDLHGHIIGMGLSPDHRYLYVNSRPWPVGYVITHPLDPPPIAQEIDIHVIDLVTLKEVGKMLRAHKAYTPNNECFFIFLDVCKEYVASGAEDKHGYLWDRHYGCCLAKFPHTDVVNSVAFNPKDPEMLVTTSDDFEVKIWRSRSKVKELGLEESQLPKGIEVRKVKKPDVPPMPNRQNQ